MRAASYAELVSEKGLNIHQVELNKCVNRSPDGNLVNLRNRCLRQKSQSQALTDMVECAVTRKGGTSQGVFFMSGHCSLDQIYDHLWPYTTVCIFALA